MEMFPHTPKQLSDVLSDQTLAMMLNVQPFLQLTSSLTCLHLSILTIYYILVHYVNLIYDEKKESIIPLVTWRII